MLFSKSFLKTLLMLGLMMPCGPQALAQAPSDKLSPPALKSPQPLKKKSILPEGKTLPEGVARLRIPYQTQQGDFGYDSSGKKSTNTFKASGSGSALVLEYGLTDRLSLQWLTRYYHGQSVILDTAALENKLFSRFGPGVHRSNLYQVLSQGAAKLLASKGACSGDASLCLTAIEQNNAKAPVDLNESNTGLPGLNIKAGEPIKEGLQTYTSRVIAQVDKGLAYGQSFEKKGASGVGDTELGLLYELWTSDWLDYSVGAGIRLPTGQCQGLKASELPAGRCTFDGALRHNIDILPSDFLMVSWQHQWEQMIWRGNYSLSDLPENFSGSKSARVKRASPRHVGFFILKPSLAPLYAPLAVLTAKVGFAYDYDSALVAMDNKANQFGLTGVRNEQVNKLVGIGLDGTYVQIPAALEVEYQEAWKGKNRAFAPRTITTTLKLYMRF
jgi:hypothetical protein